MHTASTHASSSSCVFRIQQLMVWPHLSLTLLFKPQNFDMTRIRFVLTTARTTRTHLLSVRASWTQPVLQPRSGAYFNRRTLPQFSLDFSIPFRSMDQLASSSAATRHSCVCKQHQKQFATASRVHGEDHHQTVCEQRSCSSKRVCAHRSSMTVFCDGSQWHIRMFSVSSVDSDPSSSNGLRSCALETLKQQPDCEPCPCHGMQAPFDSTMFVVVYIRRLRHSGSSNLQFSWRQFLQCHLGCSKESRHNLESSELRTVLFEGIASDLKPSSRHQVFTCLICAPRIVKLGARAS